MPENKVKFFTIYESDDTVSHDGCKERLVFGSIGDENEHHQMSPKYCLFWCNHCKMVHQFKVSEYWTDPITIKINEDYEYDEDGLAVANCCKSCVHYNMNLYGYTNGECNLKHKGWKSQTVDDFCICKTFERKEER